METKTRTSIVDNLGDNTLQVAIQNITGESRQLDVATAFFSIEALVMVAKNLHECDRIRILFGHEADRTQRRKLLERLREQSDADLAERRMIDPTLSDLSKVNELFKQKRIEARVYTSKKFHAKAYLSKRVGYPPELGVLGSGNFTGPGLTRNIELNVHLSTEQTTQLSEWFEERWAEAVADDVTADLESEIKRQLDLYDPYAIYQKALLAWGNFTQGGVDADDLMSVRDVLDPHQSIGYRRALEILDREYGVMICDGVGLGKSFIALALMEHFCQKKQNVLLIAPKNIMESSWNSYLDLYLNEYRQPFGTIHEMAMTDLGFGYEEDATPEEISDEQKKLKKLIERVDVVIVDESHNFRTTNVLRYLNLRRLARPIDSSPKNRKKVILLTATPINTAFQDLSAQLALVSQEVGTLAGYDTAQFTNAAKVLDKDAKKGKDKAEQTSLDFDQILQQRNDILNKILESVVIQRKRTTCIELAKAAGKELTFPIREAPYAFKYELSESWKRVVALAHKRFAPTAAFLKAMREEYRKAEEKGIELQPIKMPEKSDGIKFAAFLPEQYRTAGEVGKRSYQVEVFLAGLVFTNTLKQLESSPAAFQGILQSLGTSLVARLKYVLKEKADEDIAPHLKWIKEDINLQVDAEGEADIESGEDIDLNGEESDKWLEQAMNSRHLEKKLAEFSEQEFNVAKWRKDIVSDLAYLKEIHKETLDARQLHDLKLAQVEAILKERLSKGQRIIVFTQSQRTSFYLEKAIKKAFSEHSVARIDSNVPKETRADILYAFCPNYNPRPKLIHRERVDILISTDVLSEGVNMQEAECIINYDIHWNPVRLIQRIGRVDRRLDPAKNPIPHSFSIVNCLPPDEINDIIKLVNTVENRTTQISQTLGIDQAFFKATDPAGTLREFNTKVDGEPTLTDKATKRFIEAIVQPDPAIQAAIQEMPPGAFGVWEGAPADGVFAFFEMSGTKDMLKADAEHFRAILGAPVLAFESESEISVDAPLILDMLSDTIKGEKSGNPGDSAELKESLRRMKNHINQGFRQINLVGTIQPKLICWMEMRRAQ